MKYHMKKTQSPKINYGINCIEKNHAVCLMNDSHKIRNEDLVLYFSGFESSV